MWRSVRRFASDSDTEGVLDQPPVTDTILKKIETCDVFAPDFTFVATTEGGKLVPNPNVMLEYGYALRARGYPVMMPVMNTAHGPPEKLPFDMGHLRHPMQYRLELTAKKPERRAVWKDLSDKFENVLRLMIAATPAKPKDEKLFVQAKAATPPAFFFKPSEVLAEFGIYESEQAALSIQFKQGDIPSAVSSLRRAARDRAGEGKGNIHRSKALPDVPDHRGARRRKQLWFDYP